MFERTRELVSDANSGRGPWGDVVDHFHPTNRALAQIGASQGILQPGLNEAASRLAHKELDRLGIIIPEETIGYVHKIGPKDDYVKVELLFKGKAKRRGMPDLATYPYLVRHPNPGITIDEGEGGITVMIELSKIGFTGLAAGEYHLTLGRAVNATGERIEEALEGIVDGVVTIGYLAALGALEEDDHNDDPLIDRIKAAFRRTKFGKALDDGIDTQFARHRDEV